VPTTFNKLFPLWALLISLLAFFSSDFFSQLQSLIIPLLAVVMFIMGLTLSSEDFKRVVLMPKPIAIGVVLQFLVMPLTALILANLLQLTTQLTAGMVLVGSCAGGTASNVICYLAKGDVALSISMTMVSTLVGVIATPLLCALYLSESITVDTLGMLFDIIQVVLIPVVAGVVTNHYLHQRIAKFESLLPSISVLVILTIIAIIVALNADRLLDVGLITFVAVVLHNSFGLVSGFYISRIMGLSFQQSRTISIEVGMQNSGLGVALALEFFSATAALPGALFSIWHNISGSLLASRWSSPKSQFENALDTQK
jgi:BASS family bile acid:Na+ symporter